MLARLSKGLVYKLTSVERKLKEEMAVASYTFTIEAYMQPVRAWSHLNLFNSIYSQHLISHMNSHFKVRSAIEYQHHSIVYSKCFPPDSMHHSTCFCQSAAFNFFRENVELLFQWLYRGEHKLDTFVSRVLVQVFANISKNKAYRRSRRWGSMAFAIRFFCELSYKENIYIFVNLLISNRCKI